MVAMMIALLFMICGLFLFFKGFGEFRQKRLIQDIPTSTVRGLAMGLVELEGRAKKTKLLKSPFSNTACVFYKYEIERYQKSGKSGQWITMARGNSGDVPFYLKDPTGQVLIAPSGAKYILPADYIHRSGSLGKIPANLKSFMKEKKIDYRGLLGIRHNLRFQESVIKENDSLYVLGHAQKNPSQLNKINKHGDVADVMVGKTKGKHHRMFIISDRKQKDVIKHLHRTFILAIIVGFVLAVGSLAFILANIGNLDF